jgi:hypothetical protein
MKAEPIATSGPTYAEPRPFCIAAGLTGFVLIAGASVAQRRSTTRKKGDQHSRDFSHDNNP